MSATLHFQKIPLSQVRSALTPVDPAYPTVLVVDDEPLIADTLAAILNKSGFCATVAYNGDEALAIANLIMPQFLITDILMPGMNGIDLALNMKDLNPDCKTVLFSGHAHHDQLDTDPRCAVHKFSLLAKPIHPDLLLAHIASLDLATV
jgi:YesN/AraC family two-component response regulator